MYDGILMFSDARCREGGRDRKKKERHPCPQRLAIALREIGRIERTIYTLDRLRKAAAQDGKLRRNRSIRAKAATRWHERCASTASAVCEIAQLNCNNTAPVA